MLTLLLGTDWIANSEKVMQLVADDVASGMSGRVLIVPELISHDTERRLCAAAGDTASRFAEVLSFTRLARRVSEAVGRGLPACLDNGGRIVAMASAARQLHSKLKAYASVETKPEFLSGLLDAIDEFKRCCISARDLQDASRRAEGSFAQKLEELALLMDAYDGICSQGMRDPADQMTWLLTQMEDSTFAQDHVFYIDGFPDFTRQHIAIIQHLICNSSRVVISLNCDQPNTKHLAFEKAGETAAQFLNIARQYGVSFEIVRVQPKGSVFSELRMRLLQGSLAGMQPLSGRLVVSRTDSVYEECMITAERVISLVQSGSRYRDISVVCSDVSAYKNALSMAFGRCGIPLYLSGTEGILDKTVIATVLSAIDAALSGFEQKSVLKYLKSVLSPLHQDACDKLENYVILWNITGSQWQRDWTNHPKGMGEQWTDYYREKLSKLNTDRKLAMDPLIRLRNSFHEAVNLKQQVEAVYQFLEDIKLAKRLSLFAHRMDASGDNRNAQILNQLWEILLTALEQMYDVLGQTKWDSETFVRLLKLLLTQYDVGTIPPVLDAVIAGPVSAMRCQRPKYLFVLGVLEGSLPGYSGAVGILSDQERVALRKMGVPLTGGSVEGIQAEFSEIYGVFCGAEQQIFVSCPSGQPSFLYRRLCDMAGGETTVGNILGAVLTNRTEAGAYFARMSDAASASAAGVGDVFTDILTKISYSLGTIRQETVRKLYGDSLTLSASQVDKLADCRMAYFLKYGLRAKERKSVSVDPAEFGTYVHAVLEQTGRKIMQMGGFSAVSLEETLQIAKAFSMEYAKERFDQLSSERALYLFNRNSHELEMIVQELWQELQGSQFEPVDFELAFGGSGDLDPICISGQAIDAQLLGFVDRVDAWQEHGQNYFRVVDYKTGKKDFDYCDVYNGLGLQMLLYLFALEDGGASVLGDHPVPAGVQYFPARVPYVAADGVLTEEQIEAAREKLWKRKGLLLNDTEVLDAMESGDKPVRLCYTRRKDGSITGDLADRMQFRLLKAYVFALLGKLVDEIASGNVEANPYTRGSSHNACAFCPYGAVCHPESVPGRRNYKTMSAQRFWDEIGKEMKDHG